MHLSEVGEKRLLKDDCAMAVCLEVNADVEGLGQMVQVLHARLSQLDADS